MLDVHKKMTALELGQHFKMSHKTVSRWLREDGLPVEIRKGANNLPTRHASLLDVSVYLLRNHKHKKTATLEAAAFFVCEDREINDALGETEQAPTRLTFNEPAEEDA